MPKKITPTEALKKAIAAFPTLTAFAESMGVSLQTAHHWRSVGRVSADHCPRIERITGGKVRCEQLAPHVEWAVLRAQVAK